MQSESVSTDIAQHDVTQRAGQSDELKVPRPGMSWYIIRLPVVDMPVKIERAEVRPVRVIVTDQQFEGITGPVIPGFPVEHE